MGFNWNRERLLSEELMGRLQNIAQRVSKCIDVCV